MEEGGPFRLYYHSKSRGFYLLTHMPGEKPIPASTAEIVAGYNRVDETHLLSGKPEELARVIHMEEELHLLNPDEIHDKMIFRVTKVTTENGQTINTTALSPREYSLLKRIKLIGFKLKMLTEDEKLRLFIKRG